MAMSQIDLIEFPLRSEPSPQAACNRELTTKGTFNLSKGEILHQVQLVLSKMHSQMLYMELTRWVQTLFK